jgi:hypothetical protein
MIFEIFANDGKQLVFLLQIKAQKKRAGINPALKR